MSTHPKFTRIFDGVADRSIMHALWRRHDDAPFDKIRWSGGRDVGTWFEISQEAHDDMFELMPPIWLGSSMFAMSEALTESVHSVFVDHSIIGERRFFHGYCDLRLKGAAMSLRAAITARLTGSANDEVTRDEKLEAIWDTTPHEYRGYAGAINPDAWDAASIGKRTMLVFRSGGSSLVCLENLTDNEIARAYNPKYRETLLNRHAMAA